MALHCLSFTDAIVQLNAAGADVIGTNCRLGPYYLAQSFENFAIPANVKLAVYPNAGLPGTDQDGAVVCKGVVPQQPPIMFRPS
ncbi:hypothetical protein WP50_06920 [Lactiplantibacillus plantarum]|nr:hypothetical protein WP50_06920 [Lactiplantibacillus plantarum]